LTVTALDATQYDRKEFLRGHSKQMWVLATTDTEWAQSFKKLSPR